MNSKIASQEKTFSESGISARELERISGMKAIALSDLDGVVGGSEATDEILEKLKTLSLLEASELVSQIEETFGVSSTSSG